MPDQTQSHVQQPVGPQASCTGPHQRETVNTHLSGLQFREKGRREEEAEERAKIFRRWWFWGRGDERERETGGGGGGVERGSQRERERDRPNSQNTFCQNTISERRGSKYKIKSKKKKGKKKKYATPVYHQQKQKERKRRTQD